MQDGGDEKEADEDRRAIGISEYTQSMQRYEGYLSFYWDEQAGKIFLGD